MTLLTILSAMRPPVYRALNSLFINKSNFIFKLNLLSFLDFNLLPFLKLQYFAIIEQFPAIFKYYTLGILQRYLLLI